jgi:hypothetical protein
MKTATEWRSKAAHGKTVGFVVKTEQAPIRGERDARQLIFYRPFRGLDFLGTSQPTVLPWAAFCRVSGALIAVILFFAFGATAAMTNDLSDAQIQGRQLAQQLCNARPVESTNTGIFKIRDAQKRWHEIPVRFQLTVTAAPTGSPGWEARY